MSRGGDFQMYIMDMKGSKGKIDSLLKRKIVYTTDHVQDKWILWQAAWKARQKYDEDLCIDFARINKKHRGVKDKDFAMGLVVGAKGIEDTIREFEE